MDEEKRVEMTMRQIKNKYATNIIGIAIQYDNANYDKLKKMIHLKQGNFSYDLFNVASRVD